MPMITASVVPMRAINSELPFEPEIPFRSLVSVFRDDGKEERARLDLLADRLIPRITAAQLALVEPDFDARCAQGLANPPGRLLVL